MITFKNCKFILIILILSKAYGQDIKESLKEFEHYSLESFKTHINILAADSLQGRGTGEPGGEKAAIYIAAKLREYGVEPAGDDGTFFQSIPMLSSVPLGDSQLQLTHGEQSHTFELEKDYVLAKFGAETFVPKPVDMVFVGYGITAPEFDYDDYASLDIVDKVVVFLDGEPKSDDVHYFDGGNPTFYSFLESKLRMAIAHGARGSIMIPNPYDSQSNAWEHWKRSYLFNDVSLAFAASSHLSIIMNPTSAQSLFLNSRYSLEQLLNLHETFALSSFPLETEIMFKGHFDRSEFSANNVVGILPGNKGRLKKECLVISAHYDHLGISRPVKGDSIYNGLVDNALGTATVLELAKIFSVSQNRKRSIVFLLLTGEEKGVLGSQHYVINPVFPLYKTIANINIDGLAMFDTFTEVVGIGGSYSTLGKELAHVADKLGLIVTGIPQNYLIAESFARSDQFVFAQAGIPAIMIVDGLGYDHMNRDEALLAHLNWMKNVYHTPFDDLNQKINFSAVQQHCQLLYVFAEHLLNKRSSPDWKWNSPYINARLLSKAEKR